MRNAESRVCRAGSQLRISRFRIPFSVKIRDRKRKVRRCITEGAEAKRVLRPFDSEFRVSHPRESVRTKTECNDIRTADRQGMVKELERCGVIMLVEPNYKSRYCQ